MTKLFSMKTLAFAGAAAFALTLAAAPQAQAADTSKVELGWWDEDAQKYVVDDYTSVAVTVSTSAVTISDGKVEYFYSTPGSGKDARKWVSALAEVDDSDTADTDKKDKDGNPEKDKDGNVIQVPNNTYFTIPASDLAKGKKVDLYIATDSTGSIKSDKLVFDKKAKAKAVVTYTATGPAISIKSGSADVKDENASIEINSLYGGFSCKKVYLNKTQLEIINEMFKKEIDDGKIDLKTLSPKYCEGWDDNKKFTGFRREDLNTSLNTKFISNDPCTYQYSISVKVNASTTRVEHKDFSSEINQLLHKFFFDNYCARLQEIADIGGGQVEVTYYPANEDSYAPPTVVKAKIAGPKAAPKLGLKLAAGFNLKLKDSIKYRSFKEDTTDTKEIQWNVGKGSTAMTVPDLFATEFLKEVKVDSLTEYVLKDNMKIQIKTFDKNGKKSDSKVGTTTVYASAATPTALNVKIENKDVKKGKTTTTAAAVTFTVGDLKPTQTIAGKSSATSTLQYYVPGVTRKWTDAKASKTLQIANNKLPEKIYVRTKGIDASSKRTGTTFYEAASHILTIEVNKQDPKASKYAVTDSAIFVDASEATPKAFEDADKAKEESESKK